MHVFRHGGNRKRELSGTPANGPQLCCEDSSTRGRKHLASAPARLLAGVSARFQFDGILANLLGHLTLCIAMVMPSQSGSNLNRRSDGNFPPPTGVISRS